MKDQTSEKKEKQIILNQYRSLVRGVTNKLNSKEKKNIRTAFDIAIEAHENSRRQSGELYVTHPISVAKIVAQDIGLGSTSIICGGYRFGCW